MKKRRKLAAVQKVVQQNFWNLEEMGSPEPRTNKQYL